MWVVPDNYVGKVYFDAQNTAMVSDRQTKKRLSDLSNTVIPEGLKFRSKCQTHHTVREIEEQAFILSHSYDISEPIQTKINECKDLTFLACGSSKFAAAVCRHLLLDVPRLGHVTVEDASEFDSRHIRRNCMYVLVSQSGETLDIIQACNKINHYQNDNPKVIGITNTLASQLSRKIDCIYLNAGKEVAVAATKSFSSQILGTLQLFPELRPCLGQIGFSPDDFTRIKRRVQNLVQTISPVTKSMFVLGSHARFALGCETALKLKELTYIHAEAFETGSLKHGPLALVEPGVNVLVLFPPRADQRYISTCREIQTRGGTVIAVTNNSLELPESTIHLNCTRTGDIDLLLEQLFNIQYLAYFLALERGINPDRPRNLAKTVTVS
jgi:glucosamine--fructose-6-phosphate aminotransferase (isomerizing)